MQKSEIIFVYLPNTSHFLHFQSVRQKKGNIHNKTNRYRWHFRSKPHQTTSLMQLCFFKIFKPQCLEPPGHYLCPPEPGRPGCVISIQKDVTTVNTMSTEKRLARIRSFPLYISHCRGLVLPLCIAINHKDSSNSFQFITYMQLLTWVIH